MAEQEGAEAAPAEADSPVQKKGEGGGEKPAGGPSQKLVFVVLILNFVVLIAIAVIFWMNTSKKKSEVTIGDIHEEKVKEEHAEKEKAGEGGGEKKEGEKGKEGAGGAEDHYIQESFTVNLADPRGSYFAKVDVVIEVDDDFVKGEVNKLRPKIRDFILVVLSSKTYEQVDSLDGRNFLREEIRNKINGYLPRGEIKNVYFTQFIIQ